MGFFSKLFSKKKQGLGVDDGQAKYFKEDFDPHEKKNVKKSESVTKEKKSEDINKTQEVQTPLKPAVKAEKTARVCQATKADTEKGKKLTNVKNEEELVDNSPEVKEAVAVKESRSTANGKFDIRRAKDGRFFFSLYASNHTVIAYSQIYSSISAVNTGINSVIANATKADTEDTTLKKPVSLSCPKWEIYIDKAGEYRFRLYASNGLCVCHSSHGYSTKSGCKGGIESIKRFAAEAKVDKSYLK